MGNDLELAACRCRPVEAQSFNPKARLPYGCTVEDIRKVMTDFAEFLTFVNQQLHSREMVRLESMLMPANFSSMVGEFVTAHIPRYCSGLVRNKHHNGHPDLIPANRFANDAVQYTHDGIEVKASRYLRGWQGHNPENVWLMVFVFDSSRPVDPVKGVPPKPFGFLVVAGAKLAKDDWAFAGRSETSRRTITASVTETGWEKTMANWIYKAPELL